MRNLHNWRIYAISQHFHHPMIVFASKEGANPVEHLWVHLKWDILVPLLGKIRLGW